MSEKLTVTMKKGGQVREVPKGKIKKFIDQGFVEVALNDKGALVAKGGAVEWEQKYNKLLKEFNVLEAKYEKLLPKDNPEVVKLKAQYKELYSKAPAHNISLEKLKEKVAAGKQE